ncbi:putative lysine-specific demethylase JMJ16 [Cucurbita maxima]|uniref:Lysine-specific demethylase JMJ16 n=1 Tax=Cucurbita maxima TaxID=3661 RepID=A0A6J1KBW7_CUCMA|nr:putative lysine-specific demethylase JMJ16 [Cucurbita maxima]
MGTKLIRACVEEDSDDFPSVPPGFESYISFSLGKVHDHEKQDGCVPASGSATVSESQPVKVESEVEVANVAKVTRSLRRKPCVNYRQYDYCSGDELDTKHLDQNFSLRPSLSKGVIRGCPHCNNCQKVIARWRPEESCRPNLEDAPVFYPTEEEFGDTLTYIASIRAKAEPYGICRIVPPSSWKPPCPLKQKHIWESSKFATRVQRIDKLQNRDSLRKNYRFCSQMRRKRRRGNRKGVDVTILNGINGDAGPYEAERFGFDPGPDFSLALFQKYADDFKSQYFSKPLDDTSKGCNPSMLPENEHWKPSLENIEGEYWRMVEKPTEEIEVLYGADLETGEFGSGFLKSCSQEGSTSDEEKYVKSGWNLNNFPKLPGSVLSYENSNISGVLVPWLYIGMCFSSFCWHVEDHHLYSLNYMHWGDPKVWYGVPGNGASKLEDAMKKHLPDLFQEQPDLLHKLVTQLSPSILKIEGVPVYRCIQNPGEFVLTFPRAYHSGFNSGFNCAEAVNVAPVDWLPHGQIAVELYREQGRRTTISHDKLLLGAAREAVRAHWELNFLKKHTLDNLRWNNVCGKDGILARAFKTRVEMECARRNLPCSSSTAIKMESNFDASNERECISCLFDLHLSAVGCHCSPDKYVCLNHAKQLCSCAWEKRIFLFRYDISELNVLLEALEGKLSAVYRWARQNLGLALSTSRELSSQSSSMSLGKPQWKEILRQSSLLPALTAIDSASHHAKMLSTVNGSGKVVEQQNYKSEVKNENHDLVATNSRHTDSQSCKEDTNALNLDKMCTENVILLSDDEGDEHKKTISNGVAENLSVKPLETSNRCIDSKASLCNYNDNTSLHCPVTDATTIEEKEVHLLIERKSNNCQSSVVPLNRNAANAIQNNNFSEAGLGHSNKVFSASTDIDSRKSQTCGSGKPNEGKHGNVGTSATSCVLDPSRTTASLSYNQANMDRFLRQKGPRMAKLVRRINCNVEPLEYGTVLSGKSWSNSRAIFPKGFKSRVKYISVLDPSTLCYYVSEILDAGRDGPLFMVVLEHCPSEVFVHVSAARCWELVRDRVNQEIAKQHKLGRMNLPPLQPPGSLDGLEMFGFTSPTIVQAIEAMDRNRVCCEYWDSRPYSRPHVHSPQLSRSTDMNCNMQTTERNHRGVDPRQAGVDIIVLRGLLKKANIDELNLLYTILNDSSRATVDQGALTRLLNEEIQSHRR